MKGLGTARAGMLAFYESILGGCQESLRSAEQRSLRNTEQRPREPTGDAFLAFPDWQEDCERRFHRAGSDADARLARTAREAAVSEACFPLREGLRDHGARLRQDQQHAGVVSLEQEELLIDRSMVAALGPPEITKNELAAEVLQAYRELRLRVVGSSMLPAIWPGDILSIRPCGIADAGLGDIVLFTREGRLFAHRVVSCCGDSLLTQGDGIRDPDPPVKPGELIGRVFEIVRRGKALRPQPRLSLAGRITAALASRSAGAGRLLTRLRGLPGGTPS